MNYRMIARSIGFILLSMAGLMLLPLIVGLCFGERVVNFIITIGIALFIGCCLLLAKPRTQTIYAPEGFVIVALGWISISLLGAIPFVISGDIPHYIDALFETVSSFTTTGATILDDVEGLSKSCQTWRIFGHWIGGMGVLVFIMAVMPMTGEHSSHILRAEMPGPTYSKLVPKARNTVLILYAIYVLLTAAETAFLMGGGMSFYEALLHSFSTAGTGGFSTRNAGTAAFDSRYIENVISAFMLIFSVNFNIYFLIAIGKLKQALKSEELNWFLGIVALAIGAVCLCLRGIYPDFRTAFHYALFNVSSIVSTTGMTNVDFNLWPEYGKWVLIGLMFIGGCAGSTAGGIKISRVVILIKACALDMLRLSHPRAVSCVRLDGKKVSHGTVDAIQTYFVIYILLLAFGSLLVSYDRQGISTSFTAVVACLSNVGPGMSKVGPAGNYSIFSSFSKIVLMLEMFLGRLEVYPMMMLFYPRTWKRG